MARHPVPRRLRSAGSQPILLQSLAFNLAAAPQLSTGGYQSNITLWLLPTCQSSNHLLPNTTYEPFWIQFGWQFTQSQIGAGQMVFDLTQNTQNYTIIQPNQSFYAYIFMDGGFTNIQTSRIDRWWNPDTSACFEGRVV